MFNVFLLLPWAHRFHLLPREHFWDSYRTHCPNSIPAQPVCLAFHTQHLLNRYAQQTCSTHLRLSPLVATVAAINYTRSAREASKELASCSEDLLSQGCPRSSMYECVRI